MTDAQDHLGEFRAVGLDFLEQLDAVVVAVAASSPAIVSLPTPKCALSACISAGWQHRLDVQPVAEATSSSG